MLSANDLSWMRSTQADNMPDVCNISRATLSSDGIGGRVKTFSVSGSAISCRVAPSGLQPQQRVIAEREGLTVPYVVSLSYGVDVRENDLLAIGSGSSVRNLNVTSVGRGSNPTLTQCICTEVK